MRKQMVFLFFICASALQAQPFLSPQVVASAGDYLDNGTISLSYTLGEIAINTLEAGSLVLTQGFQQSMEIGTFNPETPDLNWQVKAWPNPVVKELYLQINSDIQEDLILETFDLSGRLHISRKIETPLYSETYTLDFSGLEMGVYFVKIRTADYSLQRIVKIQKH